MNVCQIDFHANSVFLFDSEAFANNLFRLKSYLQESHQQVHVVGWSDAIVNAKISSVEEQTTNWLTLLYCQVFAVQNFKGNEAV